MVVVPDTKAHFSCVSCCGRWAFDPLWSFCSCRRIGRLCRVVAVVGHVCPRDMASCGGGRVAACCVAACCVAAVVWWWLHFGVLCGVGVVVLV